MLETNGILLDCFCKKYLQIMPETNGIQQIGMFLVLIDAVN